mmetsp:Transcript_1741/g.4193  ORF Transcript_1741/g.4193 Transcript_1741/m.4193 type:complete len:275 (+) Transcript_1741:128-952(+)
MCLAPTVVNGRPPLATLMKLPRYNTTWESAASRRELKGAAQPQGEHRQQPSMTRNASSGARRSQSVAPRRQSVHHSAYERRSHSTEPSPSSMRSEELPIPRVGGRTTSSSIHNVDANELVKMYDFATWNMYERIVSARRRRLQIDSKQQSATASTSAATSRQSSPGQDDERRASDKGSPGCNRGDSERRRSRTASAATAVKTRGPADTSNSAATSMTTDETDKSSSTSSLTRTDSAGTFPGLVLQLEQIAAAAKREAAHEGIGTSDEFIFEMDL